MKEQAKKLHLGCGLNTPKDWINLDGSWNAWLAKHPVLRYILKVLQILPPHLADIRWNAEIVIHDVRKSLPFENGYFSSIYASHLLEHLYLEEAKNLLKECFRILKPGGILRILVPDLRNIVLEYTGRKTFKKAPEVIKKMNRADRLNMRLLLRNPKPPTGNLLYKTYSLIKDFHSHKWMYDADSLISHFKGAGFADAKEMGFRESLIPRIEEIEMAERVLDGEGVCVEGRKPLAS